MIGLLARPPDDRKGANDSTGRWAATVTAIAAVIAPILLGSVGTWARLGLDLCMACVGTAVVLRFRPVSRVWLIPLTVGLLATLQAIPLPAGLVKTVAPAVYIASSAAGGESRLASLSVTPHLTGDAASRTLLCLSFVTAIAVVASATAVRARLAGGLAVSCVILWGLALAVPVHRVQTRVMLGWVDLRGPLQWWLNPVIAPRETAGFGYHAEAVAGPATFSMTDWAIGDGFGSYVVSNHFAAGLYLTLPVALAVFLQRFRTLPEPLRIATPLVAFAAAVWTVGVLAQSRAGATSLVLSGLVFMALAADHKIMRALAGACSGVWLFAVVCYAATLHGYLEGVGAALPQPLARKLAEHLNDPRVVAMNVAENLWRQSPLTGWGLGAYGDLYSQNAPGSLVQHYAHNDYGQLLAEGGAVGAGLAVTALGFLAIGVARTARLAGHGEGRFLAAGTLAGLCGLAVHSAFDWNLHVPANAFLACVIVGLAISTIGCPQSDGPSRLATHGGLSTTVQILVLTSTALATAWVIRAATSEHAARGMRVALVAARADGRAGLQEATRRELRSAATRGARQLEWDPWNTGLRLPLDHITALLAANPDSDHDGPQP